MSVEFRQRRISEYARIVQKRKWLIILPAIAIGLAIAYVVFRLPDIYESATLIVVKPSTLPNTVVPTINEETLTRELTSISQVVTSRSSLQPLVENAVKHGAAPKIGTTTIRIDVRQLDSLLTIQVSDDGVGMSKRELENVLERGYGLKNLIDRLNIHYQSNFAWKVESEFQRGTTVLLELPSQPSIGTS